MLELSTAFPSKPSNQDSSFFTKRDTGMFYEPGKTDHGLSKNPFNSLVIPRPIGWITSVDTAGIVNLAPYSFFNAVSYRPPMVMFSASRGSSSPDDDHKDSQRNIEETGEFVCNITTWETREAMNVTAAGVGKGVDEMALAGLTAEASFTVKPPRVAEVPVHLECKHIKTVKLPGDGLNDVYCVIFGQVVGINIKDDFITADGQVDVGKMRPIARLGYQDYAVVNPDTIFTMQRPE
jgi:flavin reductase (DIM6/NTAB) family NADH-FMN oxidoreductase RutF